MMELEVVKTDKSSFDFFMEDGRLAISVDHLVADWISSGGARKLFVNLMPAISLRPDFLKVLNDLRIGDLVLVYDHRSAVPVVINNFRRSYFENCMFQGFEESVERIHTMVVDQIVLYCKKAGPFGFLVLSKLEL